MTKLTKKLRTLYNLTDKNSSLNDFANSILNRTLGMFEYTGLPDSLPTTELEKRLQVNGHAIIFKYQGKLYVTTGGLSGQEKSPYNEPTKVIVNIPSLNLNQTLTINKNCVLIKNDDLMTGLLPTISKHGTLLLENDITMLLSSYNARIQTLISGGTDQTLDSARAYLNDIVDGNLGIVGENSFFQDLKTHNPQAQAKTQFSELIQYQQYLKSDLYNELGLSSLNNMKKERMNIDEVNANNDNIYPYVDSMLKNRQDGIKMVNKLFNGNVAVDFSGTWKDKADKRNTPEPEQQTQPTQNSVDEPEQTQPTQPKQQTQPEQQTQPKQESKKKEEK